jgi:hypothetical protein
MIRWGNEWEPWSSILMDRFVRTYEMEHPVEKYLPKKGTELGPREGESRTAIIAGVCIFAVAAVIMVSALLAPFSSSTTPRAPLGTVLRACVVYLVVVGR